MHCCSKCATAMAAAQVLPCQVRVKAVIDICDQDVHESVVQPMCDESSTAQVHPQKLSQALIEGAQQRGAQLRIGEVQNITTSGKKVTGALLRP